MQVDIHAPYKDRVRQALGDPNLRVAVSKATDRMANARNASMDEIEGERLRSQLRQMKQNVLRNWPDYLQDLEDEPASERLRRPLGRGHRRCAANC